MLTVYLCDGDPRAIHVYSDLIMQTADKYKIPIVLSTFESGETLLFQLAGDVDAPNIIYLEPGPMQRGDTGDDTIPVGDAQRVPRDAQVSSPYEVDANTAVPSLGKSGIETAHEVRALGCGAQIIFNASSPRHVFDAFDVLPVNYLLKGETPQAKFEQVFLRARDLVAKREEDSFIAENRYERRIIARREIPYFEIRDRVVTVHHGEGETFSFYETMEGLEKRLAGKDFIRVHRSYLVNAAYIEKFRSREVVLKTGEVLPLGVTHAAAAKEAFATYVSTFSVTL